MSEVDKKNLNFPIHFREAAAKIMSSPSGKSVGLGSYCVEFTRPLDLK